MDKAQSFAMQYGYYDKGKKKACCVGYNAGYKQAEKDLALTWEDVENLDYLLHDVNFENGRAVSLGMEIPFDGDEGFYGEVLKRFNEQRKK